MTKFLGSVGKFFAVVCALFFLTGSSYAGWHDLNQSERNQRIINQAVHDYNPKSPIAGGACIIWVRDVVRVASSQAGGSKVPVLIPRADNNDEGFKWVTDGNANPWGALAPGSLIPGMIIQMRTVLKTGGYTPHTAIVYSNAPGASLDTSFLTLIESNYSVAYAVTKRTVSYRAFLQLMEPTNHYTVYTIR